MKGDFADFMRDIWHDKPWVIVLLVGGAILFVLFVFDTRRHRKKLKKRHRIKDSDR
jgi:hypothetical protein